MIHLDLFSGIGGFAYAADRVFGNVEHVFCDNNEFCRAVLRKHWPESEIFDDIRKLTIENWNPAWGVDLLTGGFPCQPFSAAGLRRGTADERHLWPEMLRVIRLTSPEWIIAENVRGITNWNDGVVFEQVCADLEACGYEVQPFIIPAAAVNAPHRRDRVWFVAHAEYNRDRAGTNNASGAQEAERLQERNGVGQPGEPGEVRDAADTQGEQARVAGQPREVGDGPATDPGRLRGQPGRREPLRPQGKKPELADSIEPGPGYSWQSDWLEVATELCGVDDGLPARVGGLKLSKSQHRKEQLKAYGNAIVPQVAMEIMETMAFEGGN